MSTNPGPFLSYQNSHSASLIRASSTPIPFNEENNFIVEEEPIKESTENQRDETVEKGIELEKSEIASVEDQSEEDRLIKEKIAK